MSRRSASDTRSAFDKAQARAAEAAAADDDEFADEVPVQEPSSSTAPVNDAAPREPNPKADTTSRSAGAKAPRETALTALKDDDPYGTGIEIESDLHEKVMKASSSRAKQSGGDFRQTEVWLRAFEEVYEEIEELVDRHNSRNKVESPLFGKRTVRVAESNAPMKRLQIRPLAGEYRAVFELARTHNVTLAVLTRLVLRRYFEKKAKGGRRRRTESASA